MICKEAHNGGNLFASMWESFVNSKPTLRDIAQYANVALSTVSKVLNNRSGVSEETRERVREAAQILGYQQKVVYEAPVLTPISSVGIVTRWQPSVPEEAPYPFYSQILSGAERACQRQKCQLLYSQVEVDKDGYAVEIPAMLRERQVDAIVIVGAFFADTVAALTEDIGTNIVLVDSYTLTPLFDSVVTDNVSGAAVAVTHLLEYGHRRIGLIGSSAHSFPSIRERRQGYREALAYFGIEREYIEESDLNREDAYHATLRLMQRSPEVSAIFACNDDVAVGVLRALHELELRVPEDVSLVGFDGSELAQATTPTLTTMAIDRAFVGEAAVRVLRERAAFPDRPLLRIQVVPQLREGGSVQRKA